MLWKEIPGISGKHFLGSGHSNANDEDDGDEEGDNVKKKLFITTLDEMVNEVAM